MAAPRAPLDLACEGEPYAFAKMDEAAAGTIANWHYADPYGFYDLASDPDDLAEFLDRTRWEGEYFRVDRGDRLVGFWQIQPAKADATEVGFGLAPDLTGQRLGEAFVQAGLEHTVAVAQCRVVTLFVAQFNRRAITVYERVGFRAVGTSARQTPQGSLNFVAMELTVSPDREF